MNKYFKSNRLYCFSPPVMIITFLIEICFAIYTILRYKLDSVTRITVAMLVSLAIFQLAEYNVCETAWGLSSLRWAQLGHVAITLLPPLGIHLAMRLAKDTRKWPIIFSYIASSIFLTIFIISTNDVSVSACLGNYVIFKTPVSGWVYGPYYYGFLLATIFYGWTNISRVDEYRGKALISLMIGYLLFMIPTTAVNVAIPSTIDGIPSIMCGFAVLFAFMLVFGLLPAYCMSKKIDKY